MDLLFTRQASQRMIFDDDQVLPLSTLEPAKIAGLELMHPVRRTAGKAELSLPQDRLMIRGGGASDTSVWFSGFDRTNFPGMGGQNWTCGTMHLFHGHPKGR
jgi:hypothetical protein